LKTIITLLFLIGSSAFQLKGQPVKKLSLELLNAVETNSNKHFNYNTNEHWYFEGRVGYRLNSYFESSISVGYQLRSYIYFAQFNQPYREAPLFMDRHYIPLALNIRLYLSEFFYEKLKLWVNKEKWDIYIQISLATITGHDVNDSRETDFRSQGAYVPFYKYPYVDVYNHMQISFVAGVRFNFNNHVGLFVEGGEGLLMNGLLGIAISF
jgi:hypothetical protein